jgi:hypothetical protein
VPAVGAAVGDLHVAPGHPDKLFTQVWLVAPHHQDPVRASRSEVVRVGALGMQRVRGDDDLVQVEPVEQRGEAADLAGLALYLGVDLDLAERDTGIMVDGREQVSGWASLTGVGAGAGTADGLAVHRERAPTRWGREPGDDPSADGQVEPIPVECGQDPADRGLTRRPGTERECVSDLAR